MYENYTRQCLPSKNYRELLGTALCVFNFNNNFIIENILRLDESGQYKWGDLINKMSGHLKDDIRNTITNNSDETISNIFDEIVFKRNRIVHSFQITDPDGTTDDPDNQILATRHRNGIQEHIDEEYLMAFIKTNEVLALKLHDLRGY